MVIVILTIVILLLLLLIIQLTVHKDILEPFVFSYVVCECCYVCVYDGCVFVMLLIWCMLACVCIITFA